MITAASHKNVIIKSESNITFLKLKGSSENNIKWNINKERSRGVVKSGSEYGPVKHSCESTKTCSG
jgi:hypothetical protein